MWRQGECLPETLDWFGYDYYCTIPGCVDAYSYMSGWQVQMDGAHPLFFLQASCPAFS